MKVQLKAKIRLAQTKIEAAQQLGTKVVAKDASEAGKLATALKPIFGKPNKQWETDLDQSLEWYNDRFEAILTLTFGKDGKLGDVSLDAKIYANVLNNRETWELSVDGKTAKELVSELKSRLKYPISDNKDKRKKFQGYVDELTAAGDLLNKLSGVKA